MAAETRRRREPLIDCDVHNALPSDDALQPYMPDEWRERRDALGYLPLGFRQVRENLGDRSYMGAEYPRPTPRASRVDAWPPGGGPPASDLAFTQRQLLDAWDVEAAVLNPLLGIGEMLNLELGSVLARAANDWLAAEWLDPEPRFRASIVVAYEDGLGGRRRDRPHGRRPALRAGAGRSSRTIEPLGRRRYWPIYEACERHGLPLGIHNGGWGGAPDDAAPASRRTTSRTTPAMAQAYQAQVTSLRLRGRADALPGAALRAHRGRLRVAPAADVAARPRRGAGCAPRCPLLDRPPSELIRERFCVSHAADGGDRAAGAVPASCSSSSAWTTGSCSRPTTRTGTSTRPTWRCPVRLPADARARKILHDNAARLYGLGVPRGRRRVARVVVGSVEEIPPGSRRIVDVEGRSIGVFNVGGEFLAIRNRCPHQGGPLCEGVQRRRADLRRPGEYRYAAPARSSAARGTRWEFDLRTGASWFDPERKRVRSYDVECRGRGRPGERAAAARAWCAGPYTAETVPVTSRGRWSSSTSSPVLLGRSRHELDGDVPLGNVAKPRGFVESTDTRAAQRNMLGPSGSGGHTARRDRCMAMRPRVSRADPDGG